LTWKYLIDLIRELKQVNISVALSIFGIILFQVWEVFHKFTVEQYLNTISKLLTFLFISVYPFGRINDLLLKIDELAERILTLGHSPKHNYSDYRTISKIKESSQVSDGVKAVENILSSFQTIIILQRELLTISSDADDEGTNALMSDYVREQEKLVWMYSAFLRR